MMSEFLIELEELIENIKRVQLDYVAMKATINAILIKRELRVAVPARGISTVYSLFTA